MSSTHHTGSTQHSTQKGFVDEATIEKEFRKVFDSRITNKTKSEPNKKDLASWFAKWYRASNHHKKVYNHGEKISGKSYDCNTIVDEWFKWFLSTHTGVSAPDNAAVIHEGPNSYGESDIHLFDKNGTFVYFVKAMAFQEPHFKRVIMTRKAPLLIPIYNMSASFHDFPSVQTENQLADLVKQDLFGIRWDTVEAVYDGEENWNDRIYGCCVIRDKLLEIRNVPDDNVSGIPANRLSETNSTIQICHGGFWLLIREDYLTPGDHLLRFRAHSINYEIEAKIRINVLA